MHAMHCHTSRAAVTCSKGHAGRQSCCCSPAAAAVRCSAHSPHTPAPAQQQLWTQLVTASALTASNTAAMKQQRRPVCVQASSDSTAGSSGSSSSGRATGTTGAGSNSSSSTSNGLLGYMQDATDFLSQFSEADLAAAYARAAETLQDLQQQHPQGLPLDHQQQQQQQQQEKQQQQSKVPPTAMNFVQAVFKRAQERSTDSSGMSDPVQYLSTDAGRGLLWEVLRDQFNPEEVGLLDTAFGPDWQQFDQQQQQQMDPSLLLKLSSLEAEDMAKLAGLMDKMTVMSRQMDSLAAQVPKASPSNATAAHSDSNTSSSSSSSNSSSSRSAAEPLQPKSKTWGSSLLRKGPRKAAASTQSNIDSSRSSSGASRLQHQQMYRWDVPLWNASLGQRLQRLLALSSNTLQQQQEQWGVPASRQFQMLWRLHQQLVRLEASQLLHFEQQQAWGPQQQQQQQQQQSLGVAPLSPQEAAAAYATISSEMSWLVQQVAEEDTPARSAFWYLNALMDPAWSRLSSSSSSSSSSGGGSSTGSLGMLESFGVFLAAAANLEALRAWATACADTRPEAAAIAELQEVLAGLDDDWFIRPDMRAEAVRAAQTAASAASASAAAGGGIDSSSSSGPPAAAAAEAPTYAFGLRPEMIDTGRIQQMACLDTTLLWFFAEMEAAPEPDSVVMKWALHPSIGPKLKDRDWFRALELQEPLLSVYNRVRALEYLARI